MQFVNNYSEKFNHMAQELTISILLERVYKSATFLLSYVMLSMLRVYGISLYYF